MHEDGELRNRMNNAMCEMGSMAAKLNTALAERDKLKKEVSQLSAILTSINQLPPKPAEKMDSKTQILSLQSSIEYYRKEVDALKQNMDSLKDEHKAHKLESDTEMQEVKELNEKLKEVNLKLSLGEKPESQGKYSKERFLESQELLKEMQNTLEEDEKRAASQRDEYLLEIKRLKDRNQELEDLLVVARSTQPTLNHLQQQEQQLQAQLAEAKRQIKQLQADNVADREDSKRYQREFTKQEMQYSSRMEELEELKTENEDLKYKNLNLEEKLTKTLKELDVVLKESRTSEEDGMKNESKLEEAENKIASLNEKLNALTVLNLDLKGQIDAQKTAEKHALRLKDVEDKQKEKISRLQEELKEAYRSVEAENSMRLNLSADMERLQSSLNESQGTTEVSMRELEDMKSKVEASDAKLTLLTGKYKITDDEWKLLHSMDRVALEDAVYALRVRLLSAMRKVEEYAQKYTSLKVKHKGKIRNIRDLFMLERRTTADEIEKLELRVSIAESALERELEWKEEALADVRKAHEDHRKSIDREKVVAQKFDERQIKLNQMQFQCEDLGQENKKLQEHLQLLENQKSELENLLQRNKQKNELNTLLSNLSLSGSFPKSIQSHNTTVESPSHNATVSSDENHNVILPNKDSL